LLTPAGGIDHGRISDFSGPRGCLRPDHRRRVGNRRGADRGLRRPGREGRLHRHRRKGSEALVERLTPGAAHRPLFLHADLRDIEALRKAVARSGGRARAGYRAGQQCARDDRHEIDAVDEAYWENNLAINLRPHFFTIQAVAEGMKQAGGGAIVNFTSTSYMLNIGNMPAYTTAKAGIVGLTKGMAGKLGPDNIRVNAIAPGWVMTERQKELWVTEEGLAEMIERQCIKEADPAGGHGRALPVPGVESRAHGDRAGADRRRRHPVTEAFPRRLALSAGYSKTIRGK
jgi:NAD(P)-dependent dehydrogenase (short-subunit alcohol dehydrogenase family)